MLLGTDDVQMMLYSIVFISQFQATDLKSIIHYLSKVILYGSDTMLSVFSPLQENLRNSGKLWGWDNKKLTTPLLLKPKAQLGISPAYVYAINWSPSSNSACTKYLWSNNTILVIDFEFHHFQGPVRCGRCTIYIRPYELGRGCKEPCHDCNNRPAYYNWLAGRHVFNTERSGQAITWASITGDNVPPRNLSGIDMSEKSLTLTTVMTSTPT